MCGAVRKGKSTGQRIYVFVPHLIPKSIKRTHLEDVPPPKPPDGGTQQSSRLLRLTKQTGNFSFVSTRTLFDAHACSFSPRCCTTRTYHARLPRAKDLIERPIYSGHFPITRRNNLYAKYN